MNCRPAHARLARLLNNRGISVYCNTPLLGKINDTPRPFISSPTAADRAGIEYHHLYVAGLAVQDHWNRIHPVALYDVVDIATRVRREGSGREVPSYIIRTVLGEVDFGLSSTFVGQDELICPSDCCPTTGHTTRLCNRILPGRRLLRKTPMANPSCRWSAC
jgi:lysine 2,3-aminomutase